MNKLFSLPTALCLPASEIEALTQGQTIAAMPKMFIRPGQRFALYPAQSLPTALPFEKYYRVNILPVSNLDATHTSNIKAWAKCELCQILDETKPLDILSQLTIFSTEALKEIIKHNQHIFLAYLRVYNLASSQEFAVNSTIQDKLGKFVSSQSSITVTEELPVLSDRTFTQRKQQLEKLEPPLHPELQELQSALASIASTNPAAKNLDDEIKVFLGWSSIQQIYKPETDLAWISDIAALGNRSKQEDEGKSNYQAGTDFENVVRDSLNFLGFTVDHTHKGGAGGLDLFCSEPYPLFGECKAGKKIPNDTAVQLLNLGSLHRLDVFNQAVKLIIGPGEPTNQLKEAATVHCMAIINPETLEKLVKLQSTYRNSVDLFKLRQYLKPGQSDEEVEKYIEQIYTAINLRSQIITALKELAEQDNESSKATHQKFTVTEIRAHYNAKHNPKLNDDIVHDLLIELSSPLTGYLGREKGTDWRSDRFYFLRELQIYSR
ncbi:DUF1802 family protein [Nostoc spongiaeforme FACHB-130]|uniref:DUF1802 family protein n=1 Tax=Nostoc spongiaeforme FACHB-130 TaxID=1357510 RepID=A0ABR8G043_9NOSO|nr:DUF1802 family protein [Nostoc spongiaeforme]MBD2596577.1 DUF1802 family protein [Nostoc spongiaeforme FACHB-130]